MEDLDVFRRLLCVKRTRPGFIHIVNYALQLMTLRLTLLRHHHTHTHIHRRELGTDEIMRNILKRIENASCINWLAVAVVYLLMLCVFSGGGVCFCCCVLFRVFFKNCFVVVLLCVSLLVCCCCLFVCCCIFFLPRYSNFTSTNTTFPIPF